MIMGTGLNEVSLNMLCHKRQHQTKTTRTAFWDTPAVLWLHKLVIHIRSFVIKRKKVKVTNSTNLPHIQILSFFNNPYKRHTFWCCLIRCANMKWIRLVLWKIQSGHGFVHRRTDRRTDGRTDGRRETSIPPFQLRWSGGIIIFENASILSTLVAVDMF